MAFRAIPICPTENEINKKSNSSSLRANVIKGRYDSVDHYLDIHFQLLREDFVWSLRENILAYISQPKNNKQLAKNDKNLNVYRGVRVSADSVCTFRDNRSKKDVDDDDDTLKSGSLVCLSTNNFKNIAFATITGDQSKHGQINLDFEFGPPVHTNCVYVMIVAPAYFLGYRHNLRVLQDFTATNFPLKRHIIDLQKSGNSNQMLINSHISRQITSEFNDSQKRAFAAALTQQLAIIQGPPGTGKTHVGLGIVKALLSLSFPTPILIVCFTNHALDQFLEGILKFCPANSLIRVGGRSESKALEECSTKFKRRSDFELEKAKIIGMTTTGAVMNRRIIDKVRPSITIVEEAAEVLESHIVTALTADTNRLILIGDHKQLRPRCAVDELARNYKLEISLFERLILNGMNYVQLMEQHRMRPCISSLLKPHIYEVLYDSPRVKSYKDILGIAENMFFINHNQNETTDEFGRSTMNRHEASFIVQLSKYLLQQGYTTSQVTILAMYLAQLTEIQKLLQSDSELRSIRATTVDSFQGEESDIVLISFVRSNKDKVIGFLKTANRINVAFSRARMGLYCIGNFQNMADKCKRVADEQFPWHSVVEGLKRNNHIGNALELCCQTHGTKNFVKSKEDFLAKVKSGGCHLPCDLEMGCGHICKLVCHGASDADHIRMQKKCMETCTKSCKNGHECTKPCHYPQSCPNCMIAMRKMRRNRSCKHIMQVPCWMESLPKCMEPCDRNRCCGHKCRGKCHENCDGVVCYEPCERNRRCGHKCQGKCFENCNFVLCNEPCERNRRCGHKCEEKCSEYCDSILCNEPCIKYRSCGHKCEKKCYKNCDGVVCNEPCERNRSCGHKCREKCFENCDVPFCNEPCERNRYCGHECSGKCGDDCGKTFCLELRRFQLPFGRSYTFNCSRFETITRRLYIFFAVIFFCLLLSVLFIMISEFLTK